MPKDKFIYSSSNIYNPSLITNTNYHHIAGTSYILHKNLINKFSKIYSVYLEKLINKKNIWTDQVIWTHIYRDYPDLFYKMGTGYRMLVLNLYR